MIPEEEKALSGVLFTPGDPELVAMKRVAHNLSRDYNLTYEEETGKRDEIIDKLLKSHGEGCRMQGPIFFHYGKHTSIGKRFLPISILPYRMTLSSKSAITTTSVQTLPS